MKAGEEMASGRTTEQLVPPFRIGQGYDVHALVEGRPLILGGVKVPVWERVVRAFGCRCAAACIDGRLIGGCRPK